VQKDRALRPLVRHGGDAGCAYLNYLSAWGRPAVGCSMRVRLDRSRSEDLEEESPNG
jgi:hypothetical protein